jgi:hypothetical protein
MHVKKSLSSGSVRDKLAPNRSSTAHYNSHEDALISADILSFDQDGLEVWQKEWEK